MAGAGWLSENRDILNQLNVFPVPDGDTGTNMSLTLVSAVNSLKNMIKASLRDILETAARGTLMDARGCSGVIFSQLLAGFAEVANNKLKLNSRDIATGLKKGSERAYRAVTVPVEGTILTVIRESSEEALLVSRENDDIIKLLEAILNRARASLKNTPNLLPILAQAGVVDSGGQGYVYLLEGMLRLIRGDAIKTSLSDFSQSATLLPLGTAQSRVSESWANPYCTEFLLMKSSTDLSSIRKALVGMGEDLVVVGWNELIRVHIHTSDPERILALAHSYGKPSNVKIDDTRKQHRHITQVPLKTQEEREISIATTAPGDGLKAIFMSLGADSVVVSEQARNPSVAELIKAIDDVYADNVLLLPNDGNIIPAAAQAASMSRKHLEIIPSRNISQGLSALIAFNPGASISENINNMEAALRRTKHGEVARAVRNAQYGDLVIKENDIIGLFDNAVRVAESDFKTAVIKLLKVMLTKDDEVITIFYGTDVRRDEAEEVLAEVESQFPEKESELHYGGQSYCSYILSVE